MADTTIPHHQLLPIHHILVQISVRQPIFATRHLSIAVLTIATIVSLRICILVATLVTTCLESFVRALSYLRQAIVAIIACVRVQDDQA